MAVEGIGEDAVGLKKGAADTLDRGWINWA